MRPPAVSRVLGSRIRALRLSAGLSLGVVAKRSGLTPRALMQIEEGRLSLSLRSIDRIARGLRVPSALLVFGPARGAPAKRTHAEAEASLKKIAASIVRLPATEEPKLDAVERAVASHALSVCGGNQSAAARLLGMERKAFARRCEKWTLSFPPHEAHRERGADSRR